MIIYIYIFVNFEGDQGVFSHDSTGSTYTLRRPRFRGKIRGVGSLHSHFLKQEKPPENRPKIPKGKEISIPTIHFQVAFGVQFQGTGYRIPLGGNHQLDTVDGSENVGRKNKNKIDALDLPPTQDASGK